MNEDTSRLKLALSAALDEIAACEEVGDDDMERAIIAALTAIRPATHKMVTAGLWCPSDGRRVFVGDDDEQMRLAWAAMIDTVIRERDTA